MLTDPADTGAVTIALPEDVQTEAFEWRAEFLEPRLDDLPPADRRARPSRARWR